MPYDDRLIVPPRVPRLGCIVVACAIVGLCAGRLWLLPARFSNDPNEGWNAIMAMRALGAGPLYPPPGGLLGNNYPPLSFYIIGYASRLTGDAIVTGRLIALLATCAVAAWVGVLARRLGGSGAVAALLLLALSGTLLRPYLAMNDPQWLGHAVMLAGLWRLLPTAQEAGVSPRRAAEAAAIVLVAGLIKHNLIALPIAATMWLIWHDRRAAYAWIVVAMGGLLVAACCCYLLYGAAFFLDVLAAPRRYSWARLWAQGWPLIAVAAPMVAACIPLWRLRNADRRVDLVLLLLATSLVVGFAQQSGDGLDVNADIESVIALSLAGGVTFGRRRAWLQLAGLTAPVLALLPAALRADADEFAGRGEELTSWSVIQRRIDRAPGPVACGNPAFCYWARRDMGVDLFLYGQHILVRHDATALENALASRHFALIELEADGEPRGETPNPAMPLIERSYRRDASIEDDRRLFMP